MSTCSNGLRLLLQGCVGLTGLAGWCLFVGSFVLWIPQLRKLLHLEWAGLWSLPLIESFRVSGFLLGAVAVTARELMAQGRADPVKWAARIPNAGLPPACGTGQGMRWRCCGALARHGALSLVLYGLASALTLMFYYPVSLFQQDYRHWSVDASGYRVWADVVFWLAFYAGRAALVPISVIAIPLSRFSALWRSVGLPHEMTVAYHRWCGHLLMGLLTFHAVGYFVGWGSISAGHLLERLTDWLHDGRKGPINNTAGLISWVAGVALWVPSFEWARRRDYRRFFLAHQLHLVFFVFGCVHYPRGVHFLAPSLLCYVADAALRACLQHRSLAFLRVAGSGGCPAMTTLRLPVKPGSRSWGPTDPSAMVGGTVNIALPGLGRWEWHPFSIARVDGDEDDPEASHVVLHVAAYDRWTRRLAARVRDAGLEVWEHVQVVGPFPPSHALTRLCEAALQSAPLLLLGAGSGLAPAVAIVRRIAAGLAQAPASHGRTVDVALVCVVRSPAMLEMLHGDMLPVDGSGATRLPWLRTEVHWTGRDPAHATHGPASGPLSTGHTGLSGPIRVHATAGGIVAEPATYPRVRDVAGAPPAASGKAGSPAAHELKALLGALLGYLGCAWPLVFAEGALLSGRTNVFTGGAGLLASGLCAYLGARLSLILVDSRALRAAAAICRRRSFGRPSDEVRLTVLKDADERLASPAPPAAPPPPQPVPLVSRGARPDLKEVLARWTRGGRRRSERVAAGGPGGMLRALDEALVCGGHAPAVRLTFSM